MLVKLCPTGTRWPLGVIRAPASGPKGGQSRSGPERTAWLPDMSPAASPRLGKKGAAVGDKMERR